MKLCYGVVYLTQKKESFIVSDNLRKRLVVTPLVATLVLIYIV